jgi:hypothetical protein
MRKANGMGLSKLQMRMLFVFSDGQCYSNTKMAEILELPDTNTSKPLNDLKNRQLIIRYYREDPDDRRRSDKPYRLNPDKFMPIDEFESLLDHIKKDEKFLEEFLKSNFINICVKFWGLMPFLGPFKDFTDDPAFKKNPTFKKRLSKELFSQKSIIDEYKKSLGSASVEILQYFDALEALSFYKKVIGKTYSDLYWNKAKEINVEETNLIRSFLEYEIALSPFTSYPVNDPLKLLFMRPFERLYDDVYLFDSSADDTMIRRAYLIYSHFKELLKLGILSMRKEEERHDKLSRMLSKSEQDNLDSKKFNFIGL